MEVFDTEASWLSLLPFLIVIPVAILLKEILPGLILGLLAGAFIIHPSVLGGFRQAIDDVIKTLTVQDNIKIIAFLYLFGGMVGIMQISGGIKGLVEWIGQRVKSNRMIKGFIWLSIPFTFFSPMFRIMVVGPVMKSILNRIRIPEKQVGFLMDISTEPIIVLLPAATAFVGFMTSVIKGSLSQSHLSGSPYHILLLSLPYNFFAWIALVYGIWMTFRGHQQTTTQQEEEIDEASNPYHRQGLEEELRQVHAHLWNFVIPLVLLLVLTAVLLWEDGNAKGAASFWSAFSSADASYVMLLSIFIVLLVTVGFFMVRKQKLSELLYHFFDGGNQMMTPITLLIMVWSVSIAAQDLGFSDFVSARLGGVLPAFTVPVVMFLLGGLVAYFIGTSWGTWGLFMPLGVDLAAATGAPLAMTVGAVFASGAFGAFASPVGGYDDYDIDYYGFGCHVVCPV